MTSLPAVVGIKRVHNPSHPARIADDLGRWGVPIPADYPTPIRRRKKPTNSTRLGPQLITIAARDSVTSRNDDGSPPVVVF